MVCNWPGEQLVAEHYEMRLVPIGQLRPFKNNARTHPAQQVAQIAASIREFGFTNPILVDEDFEIIAGHGRLLAAKSLGLETVPTITVTGLSAAQRRALRLADNRIALNSGWDKDLLKIELGDLSPDLLELTGFECGEIDVLIDGGETGDPDDDAIPAAPAVPITRPGDIWRCGDHRVGCGDAKDRRFVCEVVVEKVHAAFMDPPYNVKVASIVGRGRFKHREFAEASGEMTRSEFVTFLKDVLSSAVEVSEAGAVHFICMDHGHLDQLFEAGAEVYGKRLNLCVWKKSNAGQGSLYRSHHELIAVYRVGDGPHRNNVELGKHGRNRTNVWSYASVNTFGGSRQQDLKLHPTVKPTALVADAIKDVTRRGNVVLDLFLGSGTTLIACERVDRVFRGLEIDPTYVDVALVRWMQLTGSMPTLEATGQTFDQVAAERAAALEAAE